MREPEGTFLSKNFHSRHDQYGRTRRMVCFQFGGLRTNGQCSSRYSS